MSTKTMTTKSLYSMIRMRSDIPFEPRSALTPSIKDSYDFTGYSPSHLKSPLSSKYLKAKLSPFLLVALVVWSLYLCNLILNISYLAQHPFVAFIPVK